MVTLEGKIRDMELIKSEEVGDTMKLNVEYGNNQLFQIHGVPLKSKLKEGDRVRLRVSVAQNIYEVTKL